MVSPSSKRRAAKVGIKGSGSSTALACRALGLTRSAYYRSTRESVQSRRIRKEMIELSMKHPRYGYRRITSLLRRDGFEINPKKVARIRREEGSLATAWNSCRRADKKFLQRTSVFEFHEPDLRADSCF